MGGFAGLYRIDEGRLLAAATDGVGTKLEIARQVGRLDTVGIDLVAMCADDVACTGAEPLFFLDYLAVGKVEPTRVASIVEGVAEGCRRAGCALLGGETAEHPGVMEEDAFDLAGFCVGLVDEGSLLGSASGRGRRRPRRARLQRPARERATRWCAPRSCRPSTSLTPRPDSNDHSRDELLEPCEIYASEVVSLARDGLIHAAAHVTGGGLIENVPRVLPDGLGVTIHRGSWPEQPIFSLVQESSGASDDDMFATFNMGIGMVLLVAPASVDEVLARGAGRAFRIGEVSTTAGVHLM